MPLRLTILRFNSLGSTNSEAARQAAGGAPEGLCVVAREQTAGRGRKLRVWVSPADAGLYFSIVLRPRLEMKEWPMLTLMAAVAVADALREACDLEVDIKWPNDIHAGGRKLCGILAETVETPPQQGRACIIGIGINLTARAFPPELSEVATSIEKLTGSRPDVEVLLSALLRAIEHRYTRWQSVGGGEESRREWSRRSSYAEGKHVRVALGEEFFEGMTRGLASDGALRVETNDGKIRVVRAGDVTALRPVEGINEN